MYTAIRRLAFRGARGSANITVIKRCNNTGLCLNNNRARNSFKRQMLQLMGHVNLCAVWIWRLIYRLMLLYYSVPDICLLSRRATSSFFCASSASVRSRGTSAISACLSDTVPCSSLVSSSSLPRNSRFMWSPCFRRLLISVTDDFIWKDRVSYSLHR